MDDPTNYLNDFPGAFIVVSHDYDFLGRITNCIIDIDFGTITRYTGTLKQAMRQKEANRQTYMKAYANQQRQIAKTEAYIRKNKAGTRAWFPWCQGGAGLYGGQEPAGRQSAASPAGSSAGGDRDSLHCLRGLAVDHVPGSDGQALAADSCPGKERIGPQAFRLVCWQKKC